LRPRRPPPPAASIYINRHLCKTTRARDTSRPPLLRPRAGRGENAGHLFWLTKLNQFGGNYVDAEMVKAFIVCVAYRQRFGQ
jgi:hypothetical protein